MYFSSCLFIFVSSDLLVTPRWSCLYQPCPALPFLSTLKTIIWVYFSSACSCILLVCAPWQLETVFFFSAELHMLCKSSHNNKQSEDVMWIIDSWIITELCEILMLRCSSRCRITFQYVCNQKKLKNITIFRIWCKWTVASNMPNVCEFMYVNNNNKTNHAS